MDVTKPIKLLRSHVQTHVEHRHLKLPYVRKSPSSNTAIFCRISRLRKAANLEANKIMLNGLQKQKGEKHISLIKRNSLIERIL